MSDAKKDIKKKNSSKKGSDAKKPVKKGSGSSKSVKTGSSKSTKTGSSKTAKTGSSTTKAVKKAKVKKTYSAPVNTSGKSATMRAIERQQKLEQTMPLGQFTTELPVLGRGLDAPSRRPWKKGTKGEKKFKLDIDLNPYKLRKLIVIPAILLVLLIAYAIIVRIYTVDTVIIEGNVHYTNDEIYNMVLGDSLLSKNSIYLSMKYKNKEINDVPFIQTMSVKIVDSSTIRITVYEKAMAGFVEYMGRYFYFDKDGTVVESSDVRTKGILQVMGLEFDHIVLYDKLPVESDEIFRQILEMTQLLEKYEIEMDKLYFDKDYRMTLYYDEARISIGTFDNIDEKIIKLKTILPELVGKRGVLRLDNYDGSDSLITFEVD